MILYIIIDYISQLEYTMYTSFNIEELKPFIRKEVNNLHNTHSIECEYELEFIEYIKSLDDNEKRDFRELGLQYIEGL